MSDNSYAKKLQKQTKQKKRVYVSPLSVLNITSGKVHADRAAHDVFLSFSIMFSLCSLTP